MKFPHLVSLAALSGLVAFGPAFAAAQMPAPAPAVTTFTPPEPTPKFYAWAQTPPMGWNSWDCYGAGIWQDDALANAAYMATHLKSHGWSYVVIDIQWYEPLAHTDRYRPQAELVTDANGRLRPAPNRFPLTKETASFKPIADLIHQQGLQFGLHLMRGIPRQAVDRDNAPILGTGFHAQDIADKVHVCRWNGDMYGVDMTKPGAQEYYDSVFALLASWGLDYVKVDDLSGHEAEIAAIRRAIDKSGRPIVLSISPGGNTTQNVASQANLWRISGDFWDNWPALYAQFARMDVVTPFRGPGHWPDADMIPFGNVRTWKETDSWTHFTPDEQTTLMTLWCIGRSPLMLGGNLPKNDAFTLSLLTNDEVLAANQHSANNRQVFRRGEQVGWIADIPGSADKYLALFNLSPAPPPRPARGARPPGSADASGGNVALAGDLGNGAGGAGPTATPAPAGAAPAASQSAEPINISLTLEELGLRGTVKIRDLWTHRDLASTSRVITASVKSHGAVFYRLTPTEGQ